MPDSWSLFDDYHHHLSLLSLPLLSSSLICVFVYPPKSTFSRPPPCCAHSCLSSPAHYLAMPSLIYLLLPITSPCPPKATFAHPPPCHAHPSLPSFVYRLAIPTQISGPPPCHAHPNLPSPAHRLAMPTQIYLRSSTASPCPPKSTFSHPLPRHTHSNLPSAHQATLPSNSPCRSDIGLRCSLRSACAILPIPPPYPACPTPLACPLEEPRGHLCLVGRPCM